jgi:hypothetical protein
MHTIGNLRIDFRDLRAARRSVVVHFARAVPQGLKPALVLLDLRYGLKPVPPKLHHYPDVDPFKARASIGFPP